MPDRSLSAYRRCVRKFIQDCYTEAKQRSDELRSVNVENLEFFLGVDKQAEEESRRHPLVKQSRLFIPEISPAIHNRRARIVSALETSEFPIKIRPAAENASAEDRKKAASIERRINTQLRDCGYLTAGFEEQFLAAEIFRSPAAVKVTWEKPDDKEAVLREGVVSSVQYRRQYPSGRIVVQNLEVDRFLYEPNLDDFYRSSYAFDAIWEPYEKALALCRRMGWDTKKMRNVKDDIRNAERSQKTVSQEAAETAGMPLSYWYQEGEVLIAEGYLTIVNNDGSVQRRKTVMVGDRHIVQDEKANILTPLPFAVVTANKLPGSIEGFSSVDIAKPLQRVYSASYNSWLDGITYRLFPPMKAPYNMQFKEQVLWEPLFIILCSDPDRLQPVISNPGTLPDLVPVMNSISMAIRRLLSVTDLHEGFTNVPYEKATSAKLRFASASKGIMPMFKQYGRVIKQVANLVLKLNQEFHPEKEQFVVSGGLNIDVPSLTSISDPEVDRQNSFLLYSQAAVNPFYQTPRGQIYLRQLWEDLVRSIKPYDLEGRVPTEEDIKKDLAAAVEGQVAGQRKESTLQQIALQQEEEKQNVGV